LMRPLLNLACSHARQLRFDGHWNLFQHDARLAARFCIQRRLTSAL
jgi:hypothetical protein